MAKRARAATKRAKVDEAPAAREPVVAPLRLGDVLGQERAIAALRSAIASRRIHHAWIFHGPVGVGKFTTALAFAAVILDPTSAPDLGGRVEPDPQSQTQRWLGAGTHPDLHIITKELASFSRDDRVRDQKQRNIPKAVLEEFLMEPASRTGGAPPGALASKVFIVDEADLIEPVGQNSLLKTLEEPAPGSVIILVTSSRERLLPTIRSRCQPVAFAPLGEREMRRWLGACGVEAAPDEAEWLVGFAGGSPGMAALGAGTGLYAWHLALTPLLERAAAGEFPADAGQVMSGLVNDWAERWVAARPGASKDAANKAGARQLFRMLGEHYRGGLRAEEAAAVRAARAIEAIHEAERHADASVQLVFVVENLMARLARG